MLKAPVSYAIGVYPTAISMCYDTLSAQGFLTTESTGYGQTMISELDITGVKVDFSVIRRYDRRDHFVALVLPKSQALNIDDLRYSDLRSATGSTVFSGPSASFEFHHPRPFRYSVNEVPFHIYICGISEVNFIGAVMCFELYGLIPYSGPTPTSIKRKIRYAIRIVPE